MLADARRTSKNGGAGLRTRCDENDISWSVQGSAKAIALVFVVRCKSTRAREPLSYRAKGRTEREGHARKRTEEERERQDARPTAERMRECRVREEESWTKRRASERALSLPRCEELGQIEGAVVRQELDRAEPVWSAPSHALTESCETG